MPTSSMHRVVVGLSGGVDSSVAAFVLRDQGYEIEGLFMKNWEEDDRAGYCAAAEDLGDAMAVASHLGIPLDSVNFSDTYWDRVFEHFLAEYRAGRTPNPDILCNKEIKFRAFLDFALGRGADAIATGHYARIAFDGERYRLLKGRDPQKDQSYFLYTLDQSQLSRSLFPLGDMEKSEVRQIARREGLVTHNKKDSTGICFIGERRFRDFLRRYLPDRPGEMQTPEGDIVGHHEGLMYYTLGQRQGLGIGGRQGSSEEPWYVLDKRTQDNVLIVGQGHDHPLLFSSGLEACSLHWVAGEPPVTPLDCRAKIRYRQHDQACRLDWIGEDRCGVSFHDPQRAVTPGQSVVFYEGSTCLGGGIIEHPVRKPTHL